MTVTLDCRTITSREQLHDTLAALLALPEYYGRNLNALYDLLTERGEPTVLRLLHRQALREPLGGYGERFLQVLFDAARENPALRIQLEP